MADQGNSTDSLAAEKVTPAFDYAALLASHRQAALDAGKKLNDAKLANKKMRDVRFLEAQSAQAWSRVYAMEAIIREQATKREG